MSKSMMTVVCAAAVALVMAGCGRQGSGDHFGEPFSAAPRVTIAQLAAAPDTFARQGVRVSGKIERQCPASGCWFFINDGKGNSLRVELGDYLPKLPQHVGDAAEVEGELIKKGDRYEFIGTRVTFTRESA